MATFGPATISVNEDNGNQEAGAWAAGVVVMGVDSSNDINAGLRWQNVTVPAAATITSATLHIRARNSVVGTITDVHVKVFGHLGDAPQWADGVFEPETTGISLTTANTDWDPSAWVVDSYYDIDFTAVMQEIVNGTWASGNDLALALNNDGSTAPTNRVRAYAQGDGDTNANTITIVYETGRASKNTRTNPLGVEIGMNWRSS
jgi:hypothetical protein